MRDPLPCQQDVANGLSLPSHRGMSPLRNYSLPNSRILLTVFKNLCQETMPVCFQGLQAAGDRFAKLRLEIPPSLGVLCDGSFAAKWPKT